MGRSATILLVISLTLFCGDVVAQGYTLPTGIPDPAERWEGIDPIDDAVPSQATTCPGWPAAETANCYYIDTADGASTDTANTYGYPNKPRKTIPEITYAAGSYIYIKNGPYTGGSQIITTFSGTSAHPVWIVGHSSSNITGEWIVKGTYALFDGVNFTTNSGKMAIRPHSGSTANHIAVRNGTMTGSGVAGGNASAIGVYGAAGNIFTDVVVYNMTISAYGNYQGPTENDFHGFASSQYSAHLWLLASNIHNMGGDSTQLGAATIPAEAYPQYLYVGGNLFSANFENAVDIKKASDVVISQNSLSGFTGGPAAVVHNFPNRVFFLQNSFSSSAGGLHSTGAYTLVAAGNTFTSILHSGTFAPTDSYTHNGRAIAWYSSDNVYAIDNTIYNADIGVQVRAGAGDQTISGNIIAERAEDTGCEIYLASGAASVKVDYNRFDRAGAPVNQFRWTADGLQQGFSYIQAQGACAHCSEGTPGFTNGPGGDYTLAGGSACIGANIEEVAYHLFFVLYSKVIAYSGSRTLAPVYRPQLTTWDIGAFEKDNGEIPPDPPFPRFLIKIP